MHAAPCKHPLVLTYELDEFDKEDFCERLCDLLQQSSSTVETGKGEFSLNFLTPSIRGQRAKSLLTTRASKNIQSTESKNDDWEGDDRLLFTKGTIDGGDGPSSLKKARSNTRIRRAGGSSSRLPAPAVFHNCAACGSFYINVSLSRLISMAKRFANVPLDCVCLCVIHCCQRSPSLLSSLASTASGRTCYPRSSSVPSSRCRLNESKLPKELTSASDMVKSSTQG